MTEPNELPPLVTADALANRLSMDAPPQAGTALRSTWEEALADASGSLRYVIGQPITAGETTLDVDWDERGFHLIPLAPVTGILAVTSPTGPIDPMTCRLRGQRLAVPGAVPGMPVVVTARHGWQTVPREIQRWVAVLAASQIASAARGNLGVTGGVTSVAIDDGKVTYADAADSIPDRVRQRLRAEFGGER